MSDGPGDQGGEANDDPPEPPLSLPAYVADAMQRQDIDKLRRVIAYGQQLTGRTPTNPTMTEEFDAAELDPGDVIRHTSGKSTVRSRTGQIARVLDEEAVEVWDADGSIRTIDASDIVAVSTGAVERSLADELTAPGDTEAGDSEAADSDAEDD